MMYTYACNSTLRDGPRVRTGFAGSGRMQLDNLVNVNVRLASVIRWYCQNFIAGIIRSLWPPAVLEDDLHHPRRLSRMTTHVPKVKTSSCRQQQIIVQYM